MIIDTAENRGEPAADSSRLAAIGTMMSLPLTAYGIGKRRPADGVLVGNTFLRFAGRGRAFSSGNGTSFSHRIPAANDVAAEASGSCISLQVSTLSRLHPGLPPHTWAPTRSKPRYGPPAPPRTPLAGIQVVLFRVLPASIRTAIPTAGPPGQPRTPRQPTRGAEGGADRRLGDTASRESEGRQGWIASEPSGHAAPPCGRGLPRSMPAQMSLSCTICHSPVRQ